MSVRIRRPSWLTPINADLVIATLMLVELELESWLDTVIPRSHRPAASILVVFIVLPVVFRKRWPGAALLACGTVAGVLQTPPTGNVLNGMTGTILPLILIAFTVGERLEVRRGVLMTAGASALIAGGAVWSVNGPPTGMSLGAEVSAAVVLPSVAWAMGWLWGERNRRERAFRELLAQVEAEREYHEQASVMRERVRISRELQDVIAQNVSAIIIQAGGARQQIGGDEEHAAAAILSVERAGREALADLRRTLGLLRAGDDPRRLAPQPGLQQLASLIASARESGLNCSIRTEGAPGRLAVGTDLVAYRVIEAALQAHGEERRPTEVLVVHHADQLDLEVSGLGTAAGLDAELRGISERVNLYGGELSVGAVGPAQYAIRVRLPCKVASS